jgi:pyruvate/2-oxoglutarate dehydrogenase complex dihydrolipoamide dehydrogenase (E3) component
MHVSVTPLHLKVSYKGKVPSFNFRAALKINNTNLIITLSRSEWISIERGKAIFLSPNTVQIRYGDPKQPKVVTGTYIILAVGTIPKSLGIGNELSCVTRPEEFFVSGRNPGKSLVILGAGCK